MPTGAFDSAARFHLDPAPSRRYPLAPLRISQLPGTQRYPDHARAAVFEHEGIGVRHSEESHVWTLASEKQPHRTTSVTYSPRLLSDDMVTLKVAACQGTRRIVVLPGYVARRKSKAACLFAFCLNGMLALRR